MMKTVSIIVTNQAGQILALKRSPDKSWYPNAWDIISGKFNANESPEECFKREIAEEIGANEYVEIKTKEPYVYTEDGKQWLVHPYCCQIINENILLNSEHCDYQWMSLEELLAAEHAQPLKTELSVFFKIN